jgi:plasmid stabilization system protein ParE
MSLEQDVAAARRAVEELEGACNPLTRYPGDGVARSGRTVR